MSAHALSRTRRATARAPGRAAPRAPAAPTLPAVETQPLFRCACGGSCPRCGRESHTREEGHESGPAPVVTFLPGEQGEGGPAPAGGGGGGGGGASPRCRVKSFGLRMGTWNRAWPDGGGDYVLRLPVGFRLELDSGVGRSDCHIGQDKKGQVEYSQYRRLGRVNIPMINKVVRSFPSWTSDAPPGQSNWWDGSAWHAGAGSWSWHLFGSSPETASFQDEPGFASPSALGALLSRGYAASGIGAHSFPIYWGGVGKSGRFQFRTYVQDAATGSTVRTLSWGMLIDYTSPSSGRHYFYL